MAMRFLSLQRPSLTAAATLSRLAGLSLQPQLTNAIVQGQRYASVKAQGAYKKKSKRGIPKKLGAKRIGGTSNRIHDRSPLTLVGGSLFPIKRVGLT
ncbi:hypothetical protein NQ176_g11257 [Zarea fungicola]|uniref:Uncharacterized protein n=1 Tax=Zarea fungicola TaxID=93591 RepID=A0ACC1MDF4_9HYPO|nr:hypothetical protein NQ176_g11257 [Lecanicillium fungicola]